MRTWSWRPWVAPVLLVPVLVLGGCTGDDSADPEVTSDAASVEVVADGQPARVTLREDAEERLGVETAAVVAHPAVGGGKATLEVPYAAVIYDADGAAWAYASPAPRTYLRVPLTIASIEGDTVICSSGPPAGTEVVTVGASELVGAEAGISGEE
jgi:hypothetical protein